jgi:hypothetical protein
MSLALHVVMRALATFILAFMLSTSAHADEVIEIHDYQPPKVLPSYDPRKLPAYSDEAVLDNAWTRAWLLLDIDEHGKVRRFKFLKRPGYDLEAIATKEVWQLQFQPARTKGNTPIETKALWKIEWPSNGWLQAVNYGLTDALPHNDWFTDRPLADYVPCAHTGPMHTFERDCSQPDLTRADVEPWIDRPSRDVQSNTH